MWDIQQIACNNTGGVFFRVSVNQILFSKKSSFSCSVEASRGETVHLDGFAIQDTMRFKGWGPRVLTKLIEMYRKGGCLAIDVPAPNRAGTQCYRKVGMRSSGGLSLRMELNTSNLSSSFKTRAQRQEQQQQQQHGVDSDNSSDHDGESKDTSYHDCENSDDSSPTQTDSSRTQTDSSSDGEHGEEADSAGSDEDSFLPDQGGFESNQWDLCEHFTSNKHTPGNGGLSNFREGNWDRKYWRPTLIATGFVELLDLKYNEKTVVPAARVNKAMRFLRPDDAAGLFLPNQRNVCRCTHHCPASSGLSTASIITLRTAFFQPCDEVHASEHIAAALRPYNTHLLNKDKRLDDPFQRNQPKSRKRIKKVQFVFSPGGRPVCETFFRSVYGISKRNCRG